MSEMTLAEARAEVRELATGKITCKCCEQPVTVFDRPLNAGQVRDLLAVFKAGPDKEWVYLPSISDNKSRELSKLRWWGLVEEATEKTRPDGGRAGWWRITDKGIEFCKGLIALPSHVRVKLNTLLYLNPKKGYIKITDVIPGFDLRDIVSD